MEISFQDIYSTFFLFLSQFHLPFPLLSYLLVILSLPVLLFSPLLSKIFFMRVRKMVGLGQHKIHGYCEWCPELLWVLRKDKEYVCLEIRHKWTGAFQRDQAIGVRLETNLDNNPGEKKWALDVWGSGRRCLRENSWCLAFIPLQLNFVVV